MDWKQIAGPLAQAGATTLGTIIGGPLGTAVGGVVGKAAAEALGVDPTPEAVTQAIATDPKAAGKLQDLEATRSEEWDALQSEGLKLLAEITAKETSESWISWGWRPALSWIIAAIVLQSFIVGPWALALFGLAIAVPYDNVVGISAIWLTIYSGGHTVKAVMARKIEP